MSYEEIYKSKLMTADEAVAAHIKSGDKIWLGGLSVADKVLSCVIEKVKQGALENIDFYGNMTMDDIVLPTKTSLRINSDTMPFSTADMKGKAAKTEL